MRRFIVYSLLLGSLLLTCGCSCDSPSQPQLNATNVGTSKASPGYYEGNLQRIEVDEGVIYVFQNTHGGCSMLLVPKKGGVK